MRAGREGGSGYIDANELKRASAQLGFGNLTDHEIAALLAEADTDNDGEIDFDEFQSIVLSAKGTSSKWANASAGALVWKRYNSMLDAGEELLAPLHKAATNTCEKNEEGLYIPGGSRICASMSGDIIIMLVLTPILMAVGATVSSSYQPLIQNAGSRFEQVALVNDMTAKDSFLVVRNTTLDTIFGVLKSSMPKHTRMLLPGVCGCGHS
eukprot:Stramenopile-MAST_4_protein_2107